jgi:spore coat polysaccharide biosynthesis protein SpsF
MRALHVGIILQARLGSTRLPGKALASVGGVSIIKRCLNRLRLSAAGPVVLATTERAEDDALVAVARRLNVAVYRGSTDDVLARYVEAAVWGGFDVVIRATGDNPAVDIDAPARVSRAIRLGRVDYVCEDGLPYGAAVEAVTTRALVRAAGATSEPAHREHVTLLMKERPSMFCGVRLEAPHPIRRPDVRLTVDTEADLQWMRRVFAHVRSAEPRLVDVIAAADHCVRSTAA